METMKLRKRWFGLTLGGLLALLTAAMLPATAGAVTLGAALSFSALSTDTTTDGVTLGQFAKVGTTPLGSVGGSFVSLGGANSSTGGDVVANPGPITLGHFAIVHGACVVPTAGTITLTTGAKCVGGEVKNDLDPRLGVLSDADTAVGTFVTALVAATPTSTLPALTVKNFPASKITDTVSGGLNIIEIPSVTLNNSSTLTLSSVSGTITPGEFLVLEITGNLSIGSSAKIVLKGLGADEVLIYVGGKVAAWGSSTTVQATVLAPGTSPINVGSQANLSGAVYGGGDVTFLDNAKLLFNPFLGDIPTATPPPPISLGDASGFLILSTQGTTTLGNVNSDSPGDIGGSTDTIGNSSKVLGDVVASSNIFPAITIKNFAKVSGDCITQDSPADTLVSLKTGASCAGFSDTSGKLALLEGSAGDVTTFSAEVASLPVDQALPAVNVTSKNSPFTIACTSAPITTGVYVTSTPSITMAGTTKLIINGSGCPAGTVMAINVTGSGATGGTVNLKSGFTIALVGTDAAHVVFNVEGASTSPDVIGGTNSTFAGTLVAPVQVCQVGSTNVKITGQLICGSTVTVGDNVTATYDPLVTF